jgi:2-polyprenyl-3-methyl-5-hydroxy-6-metoxy-1,4-benzoquinol methylase
MQNQWDERYSRQEYIYGTEPNTFLKEQLASLKPGRILFPAEGEGRNAVYAASLGWLTDAFDQSIEGQKKALQLAEKEGVSINYSIQTLDNWNPEPDQYDCIALIFVHLPEGLRQQVHRAVINALKPGGLLILQAFTINQLPRTSGGPKTAKLLFTKDQIESDFKNLANLKLTETQSLLNEGPLHQGLADVIQLTATKSAV